MNRMEGLLSEVLKRVTPTQAERERVSQVVAKVVEVLERSARELQAEVEVEVEGSFAKDTWLSGDVDVDVFLLFDPSVPVEELRLKGLHIAKKAARNATDPLEGKVRFPPVPYARARYLRSRRGAGLQGPFARAHKVTSRQDALPHGLRQEQARC